MKRCFLFFAILISFSAQASIDYICRVRYYQMSLTIDNNTDGYSTFAHMTDRMSHDTIFMDYVKFIETQGNKTLYTFYPAQRAQKVILTFKTEDIQNQASFLPGWIDVDYGVGGVLYDAIDCRKR